MHRTHTRTATSRARALTPIEAAAIACMICLALAAAALPALQRSASRIDLAPVKVETGQTLWQLARTHPVHGMRTEEVVALIQRENGIAESIRPGQTLRIPTQADTSVASR